MSNQYRAAAGFTPDFDGRTVSGLLVPYNRKSVINAPGFKGTEEFEPGAFDHQIRGANRVPLYLDHGPLGGKLIGRMDKLESVRTGPKPGLYGTAVVSRTADGNDALELIKDGVYPDFSVGFNDVQKSMRADGTLLRQKANLFELAVVRAGAYSDANLALRSEEEPCPTCGHHVADAGTRSNTDAVTALRLSLPLFVPSL